MNEIRERIIDSCQCGGNLTGHGSWCLSLLEKIEAGEIPVLFNESDSGLELFGLERFVEWR